MTTYAEDKSDHRKIVTLRWIARLIRIAMVLLLLAGGGAIILTRSLSLAFWLLIAYVPGSILLWGFALLLDVASLMFEDMADIKRELQASRSVEIRRR